MKHRAIDRPIKEDPYPPGFTPRHLDVRATCRHAQFMRLARRTDVPACLAPREPGSLYCATHERPESGRDGGSRTI